MPPRRPLADPEERDLTAVKASRGGGGRSGGCARAMAMTMKLGVRERRERGARGRGHCASAHLPPCTHAGALCGARAKVWAATATSSLGA